MVIKTYIKDLVIPKKENLLNNLIYSILISEETFIEHPLEIEAGKLSIKKIIDNAFILLKELKINPEEIGLENVKNDIKDYSTTNPDMDLEVYFYTIRNSIKHLIKFQQNISELKTHLFKIIMTLFLFVEFLNYNIDDILVL